MALTLARSASAATAAAKSPACAFRPVKVLVPCRRSSPGVNHLRPARSVVVRAEGEDFDAFLNKMADKFEKTENKPVVIGYVAAALFAFFTAEWLIHLPALDVLLGFPIQVVGLLALPYLGIRWFVDGQDAGKDLEEFAGKVVSKLPGLDK